MRTLVVAIVAGLTLAAPQARAQQTPAAHDRAFAQLTDAEAVKRIAAVIAEIKTRPEFVGLSVAVARGDRLIVDEGVGMADLEWKARADAKTAFRIGSLTKQFTAAAIMKLIEQGKVGLDDSIAKYVPEFDTEGHTVTIRQLLNHTSGIPNYTAQPGFFAKQSPLDLSDQELLKSIAGVPFDFDPGTKWAYSNTNYYLLGMVVAKAGRRPYADFMRDEFFRPLGLTHTRYGSMRDIIPERAQGYEFDANSRQLHNATAISMNVPGGAGALVSTAGDLVRWQIALTGGRAVSPASFQQMIGSPVNIGQGDAAYGFGLMEDTVGGGRRIWHNGGINGFNSVLMWLPDDGLRIAVISNDIAMPSEAVASRIVATLTSARPLPPLRTTPDPGAAAAVRQFIEGQVKGTTDFSTMTQPMADLVRAHPEGKAMFTAWGPIKAIDFLGVDLGGMDSYRVAFTAGPAVLFNILRNDDGKIASLSFAPAGPPPAP